MDTSFNTENAIYMPKQVHISFGASAGRDAYEKVYNPMNNSPRGEDSKRFPGPGEYKYANRQIGVDARKYSFLKRTKNHLGNTPISFSFSTSLRLDNPSLTLSLTLCDCNPCVTVKVKGDEIHLVSARFCHYTFPSWSEEVLTMDS